MHSKSGLSKEELEQRAAVLRRFRELLVRQRDSFKNYMRLLDTQKTDIESGDIDALVSHVELEQTIAADIFNVQKVIDPLEAMYQAAYPAGSAEGDVHELRAALDTLKTEVSERNASNRALLKQRMETVRHEIMSLKNPYAKRKSVYTDAAEPRALDIKG